MSLIADCFHLLTAAMHCKCDHSCPGCKGQIFDLLSHILTNGRLYFSAIHEVFSHILLIAVNFFMRKEHKIVVRI